MSPAPVYPQIAATLRASIHEGKRARGSLLPSEEALAGRFGVARNTIRRALAQLEREGLIATVPGTGRVVRKPATSADKAGDALLAYRKIAADLRRRMERGDYPAGDPLPSEAALLRRHNVSRATVRRAYAHLQAAGVVASRPGKGWYPCGEDASPPPGTSQDVPGCVSAPATSPP